jgi:PAS domain-containing protein
VQLAAAALAFPAGAALAIIAARGEAAFDVPGRGPLLALALSGAAGLLAVAIAAAREGGTRPQPILAALVDAVAEPLGDAVFLFDGTGRIAMANDAAGALTGIAPARLAGRAVSVLGPDLAMLLRGLDRGPATAYVTLETAEGRVRARAALLRVAARLDLAIVRAGPAAAPIQPPPLPRRRSSAEVAVVALVDAVRAPLARAATAASLLRLSLEAGPLAERELRVLEQALGDAERRLAALDAAGRPEGGRARPVEVASVLADLLGGLDLPTGIRVHPALAPGVALADEPRLRSALREVLREAIEAMPQGGDLEVAVVRRGGELVVEVADSGATAGRGALPFARALLGEAGGRLEREPVPGRGTVQRIALPAAGTESDPI